MWFVAAQLSSVGQTDMEKLGVSQAEVAAAEGNVAKEMHMLLSAQRRSAGRGPLEAVDEEGGYRRLLKTLKRVLGPVSHPNSGAANVAFALRS